MISLKTRPKHVTSLLKTSNDFLLLWKKYPNFFYMVFTGSGHDSSCLFSFILFWSSTRSLDFTQRRIPCSSSLTHHTSPSLLILVHLEGPFFATAQCLPARVLWLSFFMPHPLRNWSAERFSSTLTPNWREVAFLTEDLELLGVFQCRSVGLAMTPQRNKRG